MGGPKKLGNLIKREDGDRDRLDFTPRETLAHAKFDPAIERTHTGSETDNGVETVRVLCYQLMDSMDRCTYQNRGHHSSKSSLLSQNVILRCVILCIL